MTITPGLSAVGDSEFVELATFRRSGEAVRTPVWVVRDGDELLVTTPAGAGKVKRLRHTSRVELRPCSRRGAVEAGVVPVPGIGRLDPDPRAHEHVAPLFAAKYGVQYRVAMVVEKVIRRFRPTDGPDRRIVRITDA